MKNLLLFLLFTAAAYAQPNIDDPADFILCDTDADGFTTFNLMFTEQQILGTLSNEDYTVTFHETMADAEFGINQIAEPTSYTNVVPYVQIVYVRVTEIADEENFAVTSFHIIVESAPILNIVNAIVFDTDGIDDENTTIDLTYYESAILGDVEMGMYDVTYFASQEDFENGTPIENPVAYFTGTKTLFVVAQNNVTGCMSTVDFNIVVLPEDYETPAPDGETTYTYSAGETLADIPLEGENIQWYETETGDTPLPSTTALSHNTTYYAAQTVYDIESSERLAVTALDNLMNTDSHEFTAISHYPNPVKDILSIRNGNEMQAVTVSNMLGQAVITKDINSNIAALDLSGLGKGIYLVMVNSGGKVKILKIIKE